MSTKKRKPVVKFNSQYMIRSEFKGESSNLQSMTSPDESLSVRQLLINHTRGLGGVSTREGIYTEDQVAPRYTDLLDRQKALADLKHRIDTAKADIENEKTQKEAESSAPASVEEVPLNEAPQEKR
jgi:hypothetical protein